MKNIRLFVYVLLCSLSLSHVVVTNAADKTNAANAVAEKNLEECPTSPLDLKDHGTSPIQAQKENQKHDATTLVKVASVPSIASCHSCANLFERLNSGSFSMEDLSEEKLSAWVVVIHATHSPSSPNNKKALKSLDSNSMLFDHTTSNTQLFDHGTTPISPKRK